MGFAAIIGATPAIGTALLDRSFESTSRMTAFSPVPISPVEDIVADMRAGRMVILVDEEDRENEGDLVLAADHVTPEAINFMAKFGRGLICLTLTRERCELLKLPPMATRNGTKHSTAFTVSIEAAEGERFEEAAQLRDAMRTVQTLQDRQQKMATTEFGHRDVFGLKLGPAGATVYMFQVRTGKVVERIIEAVRHESSAAKHHIPIKPNTNKGVLVSMAI